MDKRYCDICGKEITGEHIVCLAVPKNIEVKHICLDCFKLKFPEKK